MPESPPSPASRSLKRGLTVLLVIALGYLLRQYGPGQPDPPAPRPTSENPLREGAADGSRGAPTRPEPPERAAANGADAGAAMVAELERARRSGVMVDVRGTVSTLLPPDGDGRPHQRFILKLSSGKTLLVAHNLDLAPQVPLERGDAVEVRGQYEWNDKGGLLHWTHHDPDRRHEEGYIRHRGRLFQ